MGLPAFFRYCQLNQCLRGKPIWGAWSVRGSNHTACIPSPFQGEGRVRVKTSWAMHDNMSTRTPPHGVSTIPIPSSPPGCGARVPGSVLALARPRELQRPSPSPAFRSGTRPLPGGARKEMEAPTPTLFVISLLVLGANDEACDPNITRYSGVSHTAGQSFRTRKTGSHASNMGDCVFFPRLTRKRAEREGSD